MTRKVSRRELLGFSAAALGGVTAWVGAAHAKKPGNYSSTGGKRPQQGSRPYWEKSYSGGPIDVKWLPPGLSGKAYKPVVVPSGLTR